MFEEIQQQPEAVQRTVQGERTRLARVAEEIRRRDPALVVIAARGTSDNAATYAKYLWGIGNGLPVALAAPALTTLYDATPRLRNALVVGISQSGESTDIVAVVRAARTQGAYTLAVTSAESSTLAASARSDRWPRRRRTPRSSPSCASSRLSSPGTLRFWAPLRPCRRRWPACWRAPPP